MRLLFLLLLLIQACSHTSKINFESPKDFLPKMKLVGEGKARLEIGEESWVFSFDSSFVTEDKWVMSLQIPTQGEMVFAFPGLDKSNATITPSANDFRWKVVHALRETSDRRNLGYPQAGRDFIQSLHQILRLLKPKSALGSCVNLEDNKWDCLTDNQKTHWKWQSAKTELELSMDLKPKWKVRATFKNLKEEIFQRVTLEVVRIGEEKDFVELRQEIFLTTP